MTSVLARVVAFLVAGAAPAAAQSLDPQLLERIQRQLGGAASDPGRPAAPPEPEASASPATAPGARVDTPEEQDLRRAQARRQLEELYQPSPIEADYRARLGDRTLRQFGYDFFRAAPAPTGVRTGAIGDDYVLGIGDEVVVTFRGATNDTRTGRIDRDGRLIIGQLPPIPAAGLTLGALKARIAAETRRTLLATEAFVSVDRVRSVSVFVGGEVERPGVYNLTSAADVATAIAAAGGVRRAGSLRSVRLVRAGTTRVVDLYGLLGIGSTPVIRLEDGDRIIVPVIGPTIAVAGAVARPAIYELRGPASVDMAVAFAGGPIRVRGAQVVIGRIERSGIETFLRPAGSARVQGGDAVIVLGSAAGGATARVSLSGFVDNPGPRSLRSAPTVAALVGPSESLRDGTYRLTAVLRRIDPETGSPQLRLVALARELAGLSATPLRNLDELVILARDDIRFLNSPAVRAVVLGQPNPLPQCQALARLAERVRDGQAARFAAVTRGNLIVRDPVGRAALAQTATELGGAVRTTEALRRTELGTDSGCSPRFEADPDLLPFLLENAVSVTGAVQVPGAYPVAGPTDARTLVRAAEGPAVGVPIVSADVARARGGQPERIVLSTPDLVDLQAVLEPGDDLRLNAESGVFESAAVLLAGEVVRPGLYAIRKGDTLASLLARAGGLTELAYPYGAIFTRQSVKEAEQEGFRRSARELNNSLLALVSRTEGRTGTEGLQGAAALIQLIANAEPTGRVVVEADPRVLAIRPDLDIVLEPGDTLFVPKRPNYVLVLGDLLNPGAQQFVKDRKARDYIRAAGGALATADEGRAFLVLPNGTAVPLDSGPWRARRSVSPPPGSAIFVPKDLDPLRRLSIARDVATILGQVALSIATVGVLANSN